MQTWTNLTKTALLGTERQQPPLTDTGDAGLQNLLTQLDGDDRERALLAASGAITIVRRAGYVTALAGDPAVEPISGDDLPLCRREAIRDLPTVLEGEYAGLLMEWLELVAARGQRVWDRSLPDLLTKGARSSEYREVIRAVVGNRGRWLARQNPAWTYALAAPVDAAPDDAIWEEGLREERVGYLRALRAVDPAGARAKLEAVWPQESPEVRAALLETFDTGLSLDDDPFLDSTLDDRRKEVRSVAQELLRRLPGSGLRQRMAERAGASVALASRGDRLAVTLPPEKFDKSWARDGIDPKPPAYNKVGERAFQLAQILASTPLDFWEAHLGGSPEKLIALALANPDWNELLLSNWQRALNLESSPTPWAEPLLRHGLSGKNALSGIDWRRVLPPGRLEAILEEKFAVDVLADYSSSLRSLLRELPGPWGRKLADKVLDGFRLSAVKPNDYALTHALESVADYFPEDMLPEVYSLWARIVGENEHLMRQRERHVARTDFRRLMRRHISGE